MDAGQTLIRHGQPSAAGDTTSHAATSGEAARAIGVVPSASRIAVPASSRRSAESASGGSVRTETNVSPASTADSPAPAVVTAVASDDVGTGAPPFDAPS